MQKLTKFWPPSWLPSSEELTDWGLSYALHLARIWNEGRASYLALHFNLHLPVTRNEVCHCPDNNVVCWINIDTGNKNALLLGCLTVGLTGHAQTRVSPILLIVVTIASSIIPSRQNLNSTLPLGALCLLLHPTTHAVVSQNWEKPHMAGDGFSNPSLSSDLRPKAIIKAMFYQ